MDRAALHHTFQGDGVVLREFVRQHDAHVELHNAIRVGGAELIDLDPQSFVRKLPRLTEALNIERHARPERSTQQLDRHGPAVLTPAAGRLVHDEAM